MQKDHAKAVKQELASSLFNNLNKCVRFQESLLDFAKYIPLQGPIPSMTSDFLHTNDVLPLSILLTGLENVEMLNRKASLKLERVNGCAKVMEPVDEDFLSFPRLAIT